MHANIEPHPGRPNNYWGLAGELSILVISNRGAAARKGAELSGVRTAKY